MLAMLLDVTRSASVFVCSADKALDMIPFRLTASSATDTFPVKVSAGFMPRERQEIPGFSAAYSPLQHGRVCRMEHILPRQLCVAVRVKSRKQKEKPPRREWSGPCFVIREQ